MGEHLEGRVLRLDAKVCHVDLGDRVVLAAPRGTLVEHLAAGGNDGIVVVFSHGAATIPEPLARLKCC